MMARRPRRIAFISPRWAPRAAGGAEVHARILAERLRERGHSVSAFATCAVDPHSWENIEAPGEREENGITVRRFSVNPGRMSREFLSIQERISRGHRVTREEEERWIAGSVVSDGLIDDLTARLDEFDALVFIPYLFGITYFASTICPGKNLIIPCLHDEPFAYLSIYRDMFSRFQGYLFNTRPEMELAKGLYNIPEERIFLVSLGFEEKEPGDAERFRRRHSLREPFILFAGRREGGKNTPLLVEYFRTWRKRSGRPLKMVLMGTGEVDLHAGDRDGILDLGFVSEEEKRDAVAASLLFCQPSVNESLSIVIMESWLAGRPVLVHGDCAVTRFHVEESNGGLWFEEYFTFEECLDWFLGHPAEAAAMGVAGKSYVQRNYSWTAVLDRFEEALEKSIPGSGP